MTKLHIIPLVEPPKPKPWSTHWSLGLAMFAAFVMPFVLLMISARYQYFVARARARISVIDQRAARKLPATSVTPVTKPSPTTANVPTPRPAETNE